MESSSNKAESDVVIKRLATLEDGTALRYAALENNVDTIQTILQTVDIRVDEYKHFNGSTALHWASDKGHVAVIELLLNHSAGIETVSDDQRTALHFACSSGRSKAVELLLNHQANVNAVDHGVKTPLYYACENNCIAAIELLLNRGANTDARCKGGCTALHAFCMNGDSAAVNTAELLIRHGADIHAVDDNGSTALIHASAMGRLSFMELLLNHGANIGARRKDGYGALDAACRNGHVKAIDLLVNFQANINEEDQNGDTPLFRTIRHLRSNFESAAYLVSKGCHAHHKNHEMKTAITKARDVNYGAFNDYLSSFL